MRAHWTSLLVASLTLALFQAYFAAPAEAGGLEHPANGTRSLGRGGAFHARADDVSMLEYNPANLARLTRPEVGLNLNLTFWNACAQRSGTYNDNLAIEDDTSRFGSSEEVPPNGYSAPYPEVCNEGPPTPGPVIGYIMPIIDGLGVGVGLFAPSAVEHAIWGNEDGSVENGTLPSPLRYQVVEQKTLLVFPTLSVGYSPIDMLRFGLSLSWGIGAVKFVNYSAPTGGQEAAGTDTRSVIEGADYFVPRLGLSAAVTPMDGLDVMVGFAFTDEMVSEGDMTLTYAEYRDPPPDDGETTVSGASLTAPQPMKLMFGLRYGHPLGEADADGDAMDTELFDVEFDAVYEMNSGVDAFVVNVPAGHSINTETGGNPIPTLIEVPHEWKDQLSLRLGGDFNVLPGMLAARAGVSFETSGANEHYQQVDFMPGQRLGLHLGATLRLFGDLDISAAYAHLMQQTIEVAPGEGQLKQIVVLEEERASVVNEGTYDASYDIFSLGVSYRM